MDKKTKLFDLVSKKIGQFIGKISDTNISKEEQVMDKVEVKKEAATETGKETKVEVNAAAKLPETTKELLNGDKVYSAEADKVGKDAEKIETTKELSDHNKFSLDEKKAGTLPETTKELLNGDKVYADESKKVEKEVAKIETTKEHSEHNVFKLANDKTELKQILEKLSAFEYMQLMESIHRKAGNDVKEIERHTESEYKEHKQTVEDGLEAKVEKGHEAVEKGTLKVADKVEDLQRNEKSEIDAHKQTMEEGLDAKVEKGHAAIENGTLKVADANQTKKNIMDKVKAEIDTSLASRLYNHNLKRTLAKIVSETVTDQKEANAMFEDLVKAASLVVEAGKDYYYYFTGAKTPKPVDLPEGKQHTPDSPSAGGDVTKVEKGTQTTYEEQMPKADKKDEFTAATEKVRSEKESQNTVMETRKKMHFTAEFNKGEALNKESFWTVKDETGNIVVKASLENIWQDEVEKELPKFDNAEHVANYKQILETRIDKDGLDQVAKLLSTNIIEAAGKKDKESEVFKMIEEIEDSLGIQESKEHDEKEKDLPFVDHVLEEMKELHKHLVKHEAPKKEEKTFSGTEPVLAGTDQPAATEVAVEKTEVVATLETEASIFDKQEVMLGDGVMAIKDKESKMIALRDKDGKELGKFPDGFGDDATSVIQLLRAFLKMDKDKDKKKEEPKNEEKKEEKYSSKSEKELQLEAEITQLRTEAAIKEKTMKCRALVEDMLEKGLIQPDEETVVESQKSGTNLLDARRDGLMKSVDAQMTEFFKMDKAAFDAFERSIKKLQKKASKDVLIKAPNLVNDPSKFMGQSDDEWLKNLPWS